MRDGFRRYGAIFLLFILIAAYYVPLPYDLELPGTVEKLSKRITVQGGEKKEKGSLNLVTVYSLNTNIYTFIYGIFSPGTLVNKQAAASPGSDLEMAHMMDNSKIDAIYSAFNEAGIPVRSRYRGVFISKIIPALNKNQVLHAGDIVQSLDGFIIYTPSDLETYLNESKHAGDYVAVSFLRNGKVKQANIEVVELDHKTHRVGLGIVPDNVMEINSPKKVKIQTDDISGPSAGLMISLEIYDQVNKEDLTKGYKIAGTGTIELDGSVGQIGDIRQKTDAAYHAGVDIFFCPKDLQQGDDNEKEVKDEVKKRGYHIRIVPVESLHEAITYLEKLEPKKK